MTAIRVKASSLHLRRWKLRSASLGRFFLGNKYLLTKDLRLDFKMNYRAEIILSNAVKVEKMHL